MSTVFYLFVVRHNTRPLLLRLVILLLGKRYLPIPCAVILDLEEAFLLDARNCRRKIVCYLFEVNEEYLEWPPRRSVGLFDDMNAVNVILVENNIKYLGNLLDRATVNSVGDAERRNRDGRHC